MDGDAERLCSLKVDYQLELGRLLDGQVSWFGTLEDLVYVPSYLYQSIRITLRGAELEPDAAAFDAPQLLQSPS